MAVITAISGYIRTVDLTLTDGKEVDFGLKATYFSSEHESFRYFRPELRSTREQLDWLHHHRYLPDVSGKDYSWNVDPNRPEAHLAYRTTLPNLTRKLGSRTFLAINPYPFDEVPERLEKRTLPILTYATRYLVDTINVHLPADFEIESGAFSQPIVYTHAAGEYRAELRPIEDGIQWVRTLRLMPVNLPREEYAEYRRFFENVAKAERAQLVLKERRAK